MSGWQSVEGILISDPELARTDRQVAALLERLRGEGWDVRVLAGADVAVTLQRDGMTQVIRDATTRQALQTAWDVVRP